MSLQRAWQEAYESLGGLDRAAMSPDDLDALAEAAFWLGYEDEAVAARQQAYVGYLRAGERCRAVRMAWWLFCAGINTGEQAVAVGWLRRAVRHLEGEPECAEHGYVAFARAELALAGGDFPAAAEQAGRAVEVGERLGDANVSAMGLQLQGRALIEQGRIDEGVAMLDEAMCFVLAGQLTDLLTGIVYCVVVHVCRDLADLRRAREWTDAARSWCDSLPRLTFFHGLCRVYRGEVLGLSGLWSEAEGELRRAGGELLACGDPSAGEAFYAVGELARRRGDLGDAEKAFRRAHELGRDPQPGLSLLRLAQGRIAAASAALQSALTGPPGDRVGRAQLLAAQVEVTVAAGDPDAARAAADQLTAIARELRSVALEATAAAARGAVFLAAGEPVRALPELRSAVGLWRRLGLPYEEARGRAALGVALAALGDDEGGRLESASAAAIFARLGAAAPTGDLGAGPRVGVARPLPRGLTAREHEVLRLVAAGKSNREIAAALVISEHTAARHVQNIFVKLDVTSRAAAGAFAFGHDLV